MATLRTENATFSKKTSAVDPNQGKIPHRLRRLLYREISPIEEIDGLRMVEDFLNDPMHLIFLRNCKKVLEEYIKGSSDIRLQQTDLASISERMVAIARYDVPKDGSTNRPSRSLTELPRFKAT